MGGNGEAHEGAALVSASIDLASSQPPHCYSRRMCFTYYSNGGKGVEGSRHLHVLNGDRALALASFPNADTSFDAIACCAD